MNTTSCGEEIVIEVSRRLAIYKSDSIDNWYVGYSPRNDNVCDEGTWEDWVKLAKAILEKDKKLKEGSA